MAKRRKPRNFSVVTFVGDMPLGKKNPFAKDGGLIYLADIPNWRGHCVLLGMITGRVYAGCNTKDFVELTLRKVKR
jgi:hypothetical protein